MEINNIDTLKQAFRLLRDWNTNLVKGYTNSDLQKMEEVLGFQWPEDFKEYLVWGGKFTPFFSGYQFPLEDENKLKIYVQKDIDRLKYLYADSPNQLQPIPKYAFVLDEYIGSYYLMLPITKEKNPYLLEWHEGENPCIIQTQKKFIDFLKIHFQRFKQDYLLHDNENKKLSDAKWSLLGLNLELQTKVNLSQNSMESIDSITRLLKKEWDTQPRKAIQRIVKLIKLIMVQEVGIEASSKNLVLKMSKILEKVQE